MSSSPVIFETSDERDKRLSKERTRANVLSQRHRLDRERVSELVSDIAVLESQQARIRRLLHKLIDHEERKRASETESETFFHVPRKEVSLGGASHSRKSTSATPRTPRKPRTWTEFVMYIKKKKNLYYLRDAMKAAKKLWPAYKAKNLD
jgi:hypothetical protein